jgi:hypothetical protein
MLLLKPNTTRHSTISGCASILLKLAGNSPLTQNECSDNILLAQIICLFGVIGGFHILSAHRLTDQAQYGGCYDDGKKAQQTLNRAAKENPRSP